MENMLALYFNHRIAREIDLAMASVCMVRGCFDEAGAKISRMSTCRRKVD